MEELLLEDEAITIRTKEHINVGGLDMYGINEKVLKKYGERELEERR